MPLKPSFGQHPGHPTLPTEFYHDPCWYACRTRARAEKQVDARLEGQGFETYIPLVEEERQWADRKKRVALPMFPGYTFARFALKDHREVLKVPGVVHVVSSKGAPAPIRAEELDSVRRFAQGVQETGRVPDPVDYLVPGAPIEVREGSFQGMRGVLVEGRGPTRVAVRLSAIRAAVSVELDRRVLRPLRQ